MPTFSARETGFAYPEGLVLVGFTPEIIDPVDQLVPSELIRQIKAVQLGEFLLDKRFLPGLSDEPCVAEFIEIEEHGRTREECGHELLFGQLLLNATDEGEQSIHVAIKPFDLAKYAAHEYAVASYLASGSEPGLTTFKPLGIYRLPDTEQWGVITKYEHSVRSLDTILWNPDVIDDEHVVSKALGRAALLISNANGKGWTLGDAQAKNIAWDLTQPLRRDVVIDLEGTRKFSDKPSPREVGALEVQIQADARAFLGSLFHLGQRPAIFDELVQQHFCLSYAYANDANASMVARASVIRPSFEDLLRIYDEEKHMNQAHA